MKVFDPLSFGPAVAELLAAAPINELGPGLPNEVVRGRLEALSDETLFPASQPPEPDLAAACRAGLWLRHDFPHESHDISQEIATPDGSFWHGIMHRREPDPDNAKYWFRRVGQHPVFGPLREAAAELAALTHPPRAAGFLRSQTAWDPYRWIDLCESARTAGRGPELDTLCRQIQLVEWQLLFDDCYRRAGGATKF